MTKIICPLCSDKFTNQRSFTFHLKNKHNIYREPNYSTFLRDSYYPLHHPEKVRNCKICGNPTPFESFEFGFKETCSKKCTNISIYGLGGHPSQNSRTKEKRNKTNLERYGSENPFGNNRIQDKIKKTNLEKYGVENPSESSEIKVKRVNTFLKNYGVSHPLKSIVVKEKSEKTCLAKYRVSHSFQSEEIKEKIKETHRIKRGVDYPTQSKDVLLKIRSKLRKESFGVFLEKIKTNNNLEFLGTFQEFQNNDRLKLFCNKCKKEFFTEISYYGYNRTRCPNGCHIQYGKSSLEDQIAEFLQNEGFENLVRNKKFPYFPNEKYPKEIDIYLPDHKLGIELDGLHYHSTEDDENSENSLYHLKKTEAAEQLGIQLLHITDSEWINKQDIVKSIILSKLGIYKERVFARKCEIREVSSRDYRNFCELNHLKGHSLASIRLGLYHQNKLVQLISISKSRFKRDEIELIRHCSLRGFQILGGLSRLLKHYVKNYHDFSKKFITYVDRRYGTPKNYEKSGFKLISKLTPGYWYTKEGSFESRIKYQKYKLPNLLENFDPSLTEYENMICNGYSRYYDCGHYKFEFIANI